MLIARRSIFALFLCASALATSFNESKFSDTVREAPIIARGRVGGSTSDYVALSDGTKMLFTFVEVQVSESLKGKAGGTIRVREVGGEKDGSVMTVSGAASFKRGEDVVLFLDPSASGDDVYPVRNLMMGKLQVERTNDGREILRGPAIGMAKPEADGEEKKTWTYAGLKRLVQEQASQPAPSPSALSPSPPSSSSANPAAPSSSVQSVPAEKPAVSLPSERKSNIWIIVGGVLFGVYWYFRYRK